MAAAIALAAVAVALVVLVLLPVRVRLALEARGDPDGAWALAGGARAGPMTASIAMAAGAPRRLELRVLGKRVWSSTPAPEASGKGAAGPTTGSSRRRSRRPLDPVDVLAFALDERRRVRVERVRVECRYSFADAGRTGRVLASLATLSGALPATVELAHEPSWELVDRAALTVTGALRLRLGLLTVDTIRWLVRHQRSA